jgi:hypothetical protein
VWTLLERAYQKLSQERATEWLTFPVVSGSRDAATRFFPVYVFLAALADVRALHRARGIGDDVSWSTLADLGRNLRRDRLLFGEGGLRTSTWLTPHFRGALYHLGRLQFHRTRLRRAVDALSADGDDALGIHIPETGPLGERECDESIALARTFFRTHFGETPVRIGVCYSWLLDPQLAEYLPAQSNIIRFQRRFTLIGDGGDGDDDILRFVSKRIPPVALAELTPRTTLERAIVGHLEAGKHWQNRTGWLEI